MTDQTPQPPRPTTEADLRRTDAARRMVCPACGRSASVAPWCRRPICVHDWVSNVPEVWDGDGGDGHGLIEESPNPAFRIPGPGTWMAMVPESEAAANHVLVAEAVQDLVEMGYRKGLAAARAETAAEIARLRAALVAIRDHCDAPLEERWAQDGSDTRTILAVIPSMVEAALRSEPESPG